MSRKDPWGMERAMATPAPSPAVVAQASSESCDGGPLHSFGERVPKVRKCGDPTMYSKKCMNRAAAVRCIDALMKYPDISLEVWGAAEGILKTYMSRFAEQGEDTFNVQYKRFHKLPTYWMVAWMIAKAKGRLTSKHMERAINKTIAQYIDNLTENLPMPKRWQHGDPYEDTFEQIVSLILPV